MDLRLYHLNCRPSHNDRLIREKVKKSNRNLLSFPIFVTIDWNNRHYDPLLVELPGGGRGALPYKPIRDVPFSMQGIIVQHKFLNGV